MPGYKLDKTLLFSVPSAPEVALKPTPALTFQKDTNPPTPPVEVAADAPKSSDFLSVDRVKAAAKTLWAKSKKGPVSKKEGRARMLRLLQWLCEKHGWTFTTSYPQSYRNRNLVVEGWVHSRIEFDGRSLCIEICYGLDETVLFKLWAAHVSGASTLLIWMGSPYSEGALNTRLSKLFVGKPVQWLKVLQVEAN